MEYTITNMEVEKRKLIKFSNYSLCITLPKWVIKKMDWDKGDEVDVEIDEDNGRLIISQKNKMHPEIPPSELRW